MSEQLKQQTLYNVSEANTKNLIWVDVYVSGTEGSAGTYASRRMTKAQLITFLNSNLSVAWSTIASKPTTVAGFGITDAVDTLGGTTNYVPKWSDSNTLTDSIIREVGGKVGVNTAPISDARLVISESQLTTPFRAENNLPSSIDFTTAGSFANNAINTNGSNSGIVTYAQNSTGDNIGVSGRATATGSAFSIGGQFKSEGTTTNKFALRLIDGTELNGKFLKCVNDDGRANWADIVVNPRVQTVTSSSTVTPVSTNDLVIITAQATGLTLANPTGTFVEGQSLMIRIKDNGTAQTIAFGTNYRAIGITLPTTTVISKTMYLGIIYNSTDGKWDILGLNQQA
jgi:hypothetical protein